MEAYQLRVVEEKKELDDKIEKLDDFISSKGFLKNVSSTQQDLLLLQHQWMSNYSKVLELRIQDFEKENEGLDNTKNS